MKGIDATAQAVSLFDRGMLALQSADALSAIDYFEAALCAGLGHSAVWNNLGNACRLIGHFEKAIGHYVNALTLNPNSPEILTHLAVALMDLRLLDAAESCLSRAMEIDPTHISAHWNSALLLLLRGDFENGWKEYEWRWQLPSTNLRHSYFTAVLRLAWLAPDLTQALLEGRHPPELNVVRLMKHSRHLPFE